MATKIRTKTTVVDLAKKLIAGTNEHLAGMSSILLAGGSYTPAQVVEKLQAIVDLRNGVDAAKATTKAKLAAEKAEMPSLRPHLGALVTFVKAAYGGSPDVLADFGIFPKARTPMSAEAKTAAVAKRNATRSGRHVMGSKQRKKVHGDVVGVTVTPVTAPQPTATEPSRPSPPATSPGTAGGATPPHTS